MTSARDPLLPSLAGAEWLMRAETQAVLAAVEGAGHGARVVGGAVRNALIGMPVKDVDIATTAVPEDVIAIAKRSGLKAIPTGIEHGTVTVVSGHHAVEVTTLRRDIETFGRHARVSYTTDWAEDARRRDFTMNALYCDAQGEVHDPLGGYSDLAQRRVRFIGDAHDRIREDYLRILRFFRFTAEYASGEPDPAGLLASSALQGGLDQLSAERLRTEMLRLLAAPAAAPTLEVMERTGILARVVGTADVALARALIAIEAASERAPDSLLRLGALAAAAPGRALLLRERLRLSNSEYERLARLGLPDTALEPGRGERDAKAFIYRHGADAFRDAVLLAFARSQASPSDGAWQTLLALPDRWNAPLLPVKGANLIEAGLAQGPAVGRVIRAFEDWWIAEGFPTEENVLAFALSRFVKAERG